MSVIPRLIEDGELLAACAKSRNVVLPNNADSVLWGARAIALQLEVPGVPRTDFLQALADASNALGVSANGLHDLCDRLGRVRQSLNNARSLLDFAAANGRKVDAAVRNSLVTIHTAVGNRTLTEAQEQAFLEAYESLTVAMAPITAETLESSQTILPTWTTIRNPREWGSAKRWSFGRFFNFSVFVLVLIGTCISVSYYKQGATALDRDKELRQQLLTLQQDALTKAGLLRSSAEALEAAKAKPSADATAVLNATKTLQDIAVASATADSALKSAMLEEAAIPIRLEYWAKLPCATEDIGGGKKKETANFIFNLVLCSKADKPLLEAATKDGDKMLTKVEVARTIATRLNEVYLPILLGWLGAHAFILRKMSKDISERSFAPGSAFNHIVRLGLGALAGLASTWLLTGEVVGGAQWKNLPIWALAFVAGYGIELVFAFMDRIINAFTSKTS